ncbi:putative cytochrome P450 4d20 [Termitomyces sp. T112]|nr:putative cytochrome P450 4d20 [Termitomyces sp. T112]KAH0585086.1 hypothetical protein H2248_008347 [Termitomyces sp. 'cryptogamus']
MFVAIVPGVLLLFTLGWALRQLSIRTDLDNIPGPKSESLIHGNLGQLFSVSSWNFHAKIAEQFGRVIRINGLFGSKYLYLFDPKAMHHIVVKDQAIYEETSAFFASNSLIFGEGLLSTQGDHHKRQRKMLNPVFSIVHMRHMIPMFKDVANKLKTAMNKKLITGPQEIDILHWMSRAALEMIGQSGFGYTLDSLMEGATPHPFSEAAKALSPTTAKMMLLREYLLPTLVKIGSPRFRRWVVDHIPMKRIRAMRDIVDTLDRTTTEIFEGKKRTLKEGDEALSKQVDQAKDILSILMKANMDASEEDKLPDSEVLGQMSTFTFAATDTTSNALSRTLHLLAMNPEIQDRLRTEIVEAYKEHSGDIPYDDLVSLPYMDAICRETLRLYPPVPRVMRVARQEIVLPLSTPIKGLDGHEMDSILVPKNTRIFISILNANRDPLLWGPDALEWKPERWLSPLPEVIHEAHLPGIYSHLMTFLGGGRACIGFKFSQLEMKVVLSTLVAHFRFYPPEKEIVWQMTGITSPTVKGSPSEQPQLPLKMEIV